jgi:hypothetical protein
LPSLDDVGFSKGALYDRSARKKPQIKIYKNNGALSL